MDNQVVRIVRALCENAGSPRALSVLKLVEHGELSQLQQLRVRPQDYDCSETYWRDTVVTDLLRKCDLETGLDREAAAVATFVACERQNAISNVRLSRYLEESLLLEGPSELAVYDFIRHTRKDIQAMLGALPDHLTPRFSGGATYADSGKLTTIPDKMSSTPTVYQGTRLLLPFWHETAWSRNLVTERPHRSNPLTVRGNKFFTVPKDGTKFRGCCKEASIPVSLQLDVGRVLKTRLRRIGIDLKTGQEVHRALARDASVNDHLATIDMSNASDTVCRVLPRLLLPKSWFELLDSLRATHTLAPVKGCLGAGSRSEKSWVRLEKFSSMGNGFTFELETTLFVCLARSVVDLSGGNPNDVKCYGDDLIVPSASYKDVLAMLRMFGFEPNTKKTFGEGPFRESCGGDFWGGVPVRAHYLENIPDEPQQWISLANGLRRIATIPDNPQLSRERWEFVKKAWFMAQDPIPSDIRRCRGPASLGDIVIHDNEETWSLIDPSKVRDHDPSWDQRYIRAYLPVPKVLPWYHWLPAVQLASCTLGLPSTGVTPRVNGKDDISGYRVGRVPSRVLSSWQPSTDLRQ